MNCPKDNSLVGFDDLELSDLTDPPLTTVAQPVCQMGAEGVNLAAESALLVRGNRQFS